LALQQGSASQHLRIEQNGEKLLLSQVALMQR
jgi:hypothetical protein